MSFDLVCEACGAPSGPSVGICPYCKSPLASTAGANPALSALNELFEKGYLKQALGQASSMYQEAKHQEDPNFLMLYGKILFEVEGPSSQIKSCFVKASILNPAIASEAQAYVDMVSAKSMFREGLNDAGELWIQKLLADHPNNAHLLFTLGSHNFWVDGDIHNSSRHLEKCVQIRPNFARAWGCLFAIYKKSNDAHNARRCATEFLRLEDDPRTRAFVEAQLRQIK
jgi:tetratricopeptide (TPR) repeat protein